MTPETLLDAFEQEGLWYWGDPARHVAGRLDIQRSWREVTRGALRRVGVDDEVLVRDMGAAYTEERIAAIRPVPGALDVLARLRDAGASLALVTNGGAAGQRAKIERFGLEPLFDCILIEGEFGTGKPDRRVFLHVLERLNVPPEDAWMVGDKLDFDIQTPKLLGMHAVWVDVKRTGLPDDAPVRPDRVIRLDRRAAAGGRGIRVTPRAGAPWGGVERWVFRVSCPIVSQSVPFLSGRWDTFPKNGTEGVPRFVSGVGHHGTK